MIQFLLSGQLSFDENIAALMESDYFQYLQDQYARMNWDILYAKSRIHGYEHVERVIILGVILCMKMKLTQKETRLILLSCAYHDIGRINDSYDLSHGRRAANKLEEICGDLQIQKEELPEIQAAIATHSTSDHRLQEFMKIYQVNDPDLCSMICNCLKDADGLDRVRLGDLDENYLRNEESKHLVDTAYNLYLRPLWANVAEEVYQRSKQYWIDRQRE